MGKYMNRIKELAQTCWDQRLDGPHFDQEKFAELIVQECVNAKEPKDPLKEAVYEFFTKYLNRVEYSDSDRPFNPITIGCCRVMMLQPLGDLLNKMRELSGAGPNPLEKLQNEN